MLFTYDSKSYDYIYSVFIHIFIRLWILFIAVIAEYLLALLHLYLLCIFTVFIEIIFIHILFIFIELDLNSALFSTCNIKFIEDKSYFEGRACYIGKIKAYMY